jgi:hypothetical protein
MKGDYSQPGLMPGRYLEQIDLPSACLVYAVGSRLRRKIQLSPGGESFRILCPIGHSLARFNKKLRLLSKIPRFWTETPEKEKSRLFSKPAEPADWTIWNAKVTFCSENYRWS